MLSLPPSVRIFVARGAADQRKSFDGLCALAQDVLRQDLFSGHVFVFFGRRRHRVKLLVWDRRGFWLFAKRLEAGTFAEARGVGEAACVEVSSRDLLLLLEGIELSAVRQHRRYSRPIA
jgi:transposase